jgi:serine/threonine protein kinase
MENRVLLEKYRVSHDIAGMPIELRRDASGVTCKAEEIESGREVALQFVTVRNLTPELRETIEVEAAAAKQINHVNVPKLYDFGFDNREVIYATEFFEGETAESWVTMHGPMPVRVVLRIALQVVSALAAATFQLVMHRAIHPGNILIVSNQTSEGEWPLIKVLNFGRVRPQLRKFGYGTVRDKTAPFASPEQLMHGTVDFRSEVYSLGCTLWSLLTGVSPFSAPGEPLDVAQMTPAMERFHGVPRKVRRLIIEMAATDPNDRPLDPVMMTERLERCLAAVTRREAIASKLGIPLSWQRRRVARPIGPLAARPLAMAAIVIALAALAGFTLTKAALSNSLWKKFVAREPIGVPVGVAQPSVAPRTTPAFVAAASSLPNPTPNEQSSANNYIPPNPTATPETTIVATNTATPPNEIASPPAHDTEAAIPTPIPETPIVAAATAPTPNEVTSPHAPDTKVTIPTPTPETPNVAAATAPTPNEVASPQVTETKVPKVELIGPPKAKSSARHSEEDRPPRAELVEPPPPTEGPDEAAEEDSAIARVQKFPRNSEGVPRAELVEPPPSSPRKTQRKRFPPPYLTDSERAVIRKVEKRRGRSVRVTVDGDGALVRTPDGVFHARRVGTTPDGKWMLLLPSSEIVVVPPPADYIPR